MEKERYTAEQKELALQTDMRALLNHFGFAHLRGNLFENPFKTEKNSPSFSVFRHNRTGKYLAKDLSSDKTWNCIDLLMELKSMSFRECITFLLDFSNVFIPSESYKKMKCENTDVPLPIFKPCVSEQEKNLNYYLKVKRGISPTLAKKYIKYLQYERLGKTYYALCFRNNSKGYSIRNRNFKGTFGISDFTTIEPTDKDDWGEWTAYHDWVVFEGFMDFLSAITHYKKIFKANIMVLNSTIHTQKAITYMLDNSNLETKVFCFLDNDEAGEKAFNEINEQFAEIGVYDYSKIVYPNHNDFNEFLTSKIKRTWVNTKKKSDEQP